jgi:phosphopantothenoylcysteine decarboxylase/phosphopantothenate--cysteine ligase
MDRSALKGKKVALGVGGGIAAYKACEFVRELGRAGAEVRVAMTSAAQRFVGPLTFQNLSGHAVLTDLMDPAQDLTFGHIELARWADLFIVAPATADLLARMRAGLADDAVTTTLMAYRGPVLLAPAMNTAMFENRATQENLRALVSEPRIRVVGPGAGLLACGEIGAGRLSEVGEIADAAAALFGPRPLAGKKVLVTAGPTREYLDPVRFLSNPSTGKMGIAVAQAAQEQGALVTVVLGPVSEPRPVGVEVVEVVSAQEMAEAVLARVDGADYFVASAAVSDWRPATRATQKVKKGEGDEQVALVRTPDVLAEASAQVHQSGKRPLLVGFAAETERVVENAKEKLSRKRLDFIVANDVSEAGAGFGTDTNRVQVIGKDGSNRPLSGTKREVAEALWALLAG